MPHITDGTKDKVHETKRPLKEGDLCFLFSEGALKEYAKEPRWASIHKIRVALKSPYHTVWTHEIILAYMSNWSKLDIEAAADLAFFEFYRIVGAKYEDGMILQNGNAFKGAKIPSLGEDVEIADGRFIEQPVETPTAVGFQTEPVKRKPGRPKKVESQDANIVGA